MPLENFFTGPGKTVLKPDELVTGIRLPAPAPRTGKVYIKHGRRKAMELATVGVAVIGDRLRPRGRGARVRIEGAEALEPGGSLLFTYPTAEDPCILVRRGDGRLVAYSQVCTHLSCAVVHRPAADELFCPCHQGHFDCLDGRPTAGPPTRRLPRVLLERAGEAVFAVGIEV